MKKDLSELDKWRMKNIGFESPKGASFGAFRIVMRSCVLQVISSGDSIDYPESKGWEHVSVSTGSRCPTWDEMCFIKNLFWSAEETVIQFHPKSTKYVNTHQFCLHLWKKGDHELPPELFV